MCVNVSFISLLYTLVFGCSTNKVCGCPWNRYTFKYASSEFRHNYVPLGYSSVSEAWTVFVYVNGGASAIWDA